MGGKFSARKKGMVRYPMDPHDPIDLSWRIDFGYLSKVVANGHRIIDAILGNIRIPRMLRCALLEGAHLFQMYGRSLRVHVGRSKSCSYISFLASATPCLQGLRRLPQALGIVSNNNYKRAASRRELSVISGQLSVNGIGSRQDAVNHL